MVGCDGCWCGRVVWGVRSRCRWVGDWGLRGGVWGRLGVWCRGVSRACPGVGVVFR